MAIKVLGCESEQISLRNKRVELDKAWENKVSSG